MKNKKNIKMWLLFLALTQAGISVSATEGDVPKMSANTSTGTTVPDQVATAPAEGKKEIPTQESFLEAINKILEDDKKIKALIEIVENKKTEEGEFKDFVFPTESGDLENIKNWAKTKLAEESVKQAKIKMDAAQWTRDENQIKCKISIESSGKVYTIDAKEASFAKAFGKTLAALAQDIAKKNVDESTITTTVAKEIKPLDEQVEKAMQVVYKFYTDAFGSKDPDDEVFKTILEEKEIQIKEGDEAIKYKKMSLPNFNDIKSALSSSDVFKSDGAFSKAAEKVLTVAGALPYVGQCALLKMHALASKNNGWFSLRKSGPALDLTVFGKAIEEQSKERKQRESYESKKNEAQGEELIQLILEALAEKDDETKDEHGAKKLLNHIGFEGIGYYTGFFANKIEVNNNDFSNLKQKAQFIHLKDMVIDKAKEWKRDSDIKDADVTAYLLKIVKEALEIINEQDAEKVKFGDEDFNEYRWGQTGWGTKGITPHVIKRYQIAKKIAEAEKVDKESKDKENLEKLRKELDLAKTIEKSSEKNQNQEDVVSKPTESENSIDGAADLQIKTPEQTQSTPMSGEDSPNKTASDGATNTVETPVSGSSDEKTYSKSDAATKSISSSGTAESGGAGTGSVTVNETSSVANTSSEGAEKTSPASAPQTVVTSVSSTSAVPNTSQVPQQQTEDTASNKSESVSNQKESDNVSQFSRLKSIKRRGGARRSRGVAVRSMRRGDSVAAKTAASSAASTVKTSKAATASATARVTTERRGVSTKRGGADLLANSRRKLNSKRIPQTMANAKQEQTLIQQAKLEEFESRISRTVQYKFLDTLNNLDENQIVETKKPTIAKRGTKRVKKTAVQIRMDARKKEKTMKEAINEVVENENIKTTEQIVQIWAEKGLTSKDVYEYISKYIDSEEVKALMEKYEKMANEESTAAEQAPTPAQENARPAATSAAPQETAVANNSSNTAPAQTDANSNAGPQNVQSVTADPKSENPSGVNSGTAGNAVTQNAVQLAAAPQTTVSSIAAPAQENAGPGATSAAPQETAVANNSSNTPPAQAAASGQAQVTGDNQTQATGSQEAGIDAGKKIEVSKEAMDKFVKEWKGKIADIQTKMEALSKVLSEEKGKGKDFDSSAADSAIDKAKTQIKVVVEKIQELDKKLNDFYGPSFKDIKEFEEKREDLLKKINKIQDDIKELTGTEGVQGLLGKAHGDVAALIKNLKDNEIDYLNIQKTLNDTEQLVNEFLQYFQYKNRDQFTSKFDAFLQAKKTGIEAASTSQVQASANQGPNAAGVQNAAQNSQVNKVSVEKKKDPQ